MSAHTPGPWHWWDESTDRPPQYDLAYLHSNGRRILSMYGGSGFNALGKTPEDRANAALIAEAPELLARLRVAVAMLEAIDSVLGAKSMHGVLNLNELASARAAISRATETKEQP